MSTAEKPLAWLGTSHKDLTEMPADVQDIFGYALHLAQNGERHNKAKPFKIRGETGLVEVVDDFDGNTYRAIYTIHYNETVYVIHCFQKKSTFGIKTPKQEIDVIVHRLKRLKEILAAR